MSYVDGFLAAVPEANKAAYKAMAEKVATGFHRHGAVRVVETWSDDVPEGKLTDFRRSVQAEAGEAVVFAWIEWPSKEVRDAAWAAIQADPEMKPDADMPFDGKRLVYGGFATLFDTKA